MQTFLALPWYGIGGVPLEEPAIDGGGPEDDAPTREEAVETAQELAPLEGVPASTFGAASEVEHESVARKRRVRRKRAIDSTKKLRRSTRLAEKEQPMYEDPSTKAERIQVARVDFSGASRRLRAAISKTHLLTNPSSPLTDVQSQADSASACGASEDDLTKLSEELLVQPGSE